MAELFKFRCYQCQKLIGAPASKFGKVVNCPRCRVELIVPSPDDQEPPPEPPDPDAFRPEDLGISLEPEPLVKPKIAQTSQTPQEPVGPDPIAFLQQVAEAGEAPGDELPDEAKDSNGEVPDEPKT
jgi:phage FluMu protein Com